MDHVARAAERCWVCVTHAGETGTIASTPAVVNAVVDALAEYGITHIDMPATTERVWEAIQAASR